MEYNFIISLLSFLLVLTPIVFIHELGHFFIARQFNVHVEIFSVGFGPVLFSKKDKYGTLWQLASIPVGGFVKMQGDFIIKSKKNHVNFKEGDFNNAKSWQRFLIVLAGPLANVLLTILIITGIYLFIGKYEIPSTISSVVKGSAAEQGGLLSDDEILEINNIKVNDFFKVRQIIMENPGKELLVEISRDSQIKEIFITPKSVWSEELELNIGQIGVVFNNGSLKRYGFSESIFYAFIDTVDLIRSMLRGLKRIVSGNVQQGEVGGPIRIAELSGQALISGWLSLLYFGALISVNLALINLLPIPALDGGHMVLYLIEMIFRRPLPEKMQNMLLRLGLSLLLALMIMITFIDLNRYF